MIRNLLCLLIFLFSIKISAGQDSRLSITTGSPLLAEGRLNASRFELEQNSPNPFDGITEVAFSTPVLGFVEFKIVNLIGKEVIRQVMEAEQGRNTIRIDGSDLMPGVYVYSLSNGSQTLTRRMVISKK